MKRLRDLFSPVSGPAPAGSPTAAEGASRRPRFTLDRVALLHLGQQLRRADGALQTLAHLREAGSMGRLFALPALLGQAIDFAIPAVPVSTWLRTRGYIPIPGLVGEIVAELLQAGSMSGDTAFDAHTRLRAPKGMDGPILLSIDEDEDATAWVHAKRKPEAQVLVRSIAWIQGQDLALVVDGESGRLVPLGEPPPYDGEPTVAMWSDDLGDDSVLFFGLSGAGKSLLCRHLARHKDPSVRLLKVSATAVRSLSPGSSLSAITEWLGPSALVLDDLQDLELEDDDRTRRGLSADVLAELEILAARRIRVYGTWMVLPRSEYDHNDRIGGMYLAGVRPGRFDRTITLPLPPPAKRQAILMRILDRSAPAEWVKLTEGLPPAWLAQFALRMKARPDQNPTLVVKELKRSAPSGRRGKGRERDYLYQQIHNLSHGMDDLWTRIGDLETASGTAGPPSAETMLPPSARRFGPSRASRKARLKPGPTPVARSDEESSDVA